VRKLCRTALLSVIPLLSIQPATLFIPGVSAGAAPAAAQQPKKKNKSKHKNRKQKILKGRHSKHSRKPA
jgi:hypothetical protein